MFSKILHANDGSEHAFHAFAIALAMAKQNNSELHMVSVEEIDYMPDFIEEVREETGLTQGWWQDGGLRVRHRGAAPSNDRQRV